MTQTFTVLSQVFPSLSHKKHTHTVKTQDHDDEESHHIIVLGLKPSFPASMVLADFSF